MSSVTPPSLPPTPPETPSRRKPGGHPVLTSVAIAAVVLSSFAFLSLRSKTLKALNDLCPAWTTGFETPGDWAFLVPSAAVVAAAVAVVGLLAAVSAMKWKRGALAASLAALVAAPLLFGHAVLSLHMAFFARIGEAVAAHSEPATPDPATNAPAASESHAETAESAEPRPGEAGPLHEGAAERSEAGGVSRAEGAELLPEQVGVGSRPDEGEDKHVVANEVDE